MELNQSALEALAAALGLILGLPLGLAIYALLLKYAAKWSKEFLAVVRDYTPRLIEQVDEPGDPAIVQMDAWLDRLRPYDWDRLIARVLPAMLRAAADAIAAQEQEAPASEANLGGAVHKS